jgi:hypothetical protein
LTPALGKLDLGQRGGWKLIGRPSIGGGGRRWGAIGVRPDKRSSGEFDGSQGFLVLGRRAWWQQPAQRVAGDAWHWCPFTGQEEVGRLIPGSLFAAAALEDEVASAA